MALSWCKNNIADASETEIRLYSDSELVVKQLNGKYKVRSEALKGMNRKVSRLVRGFKSVLFTNVRRENRGVSAVDKALNELLDDIEAKRTRAR